MGGNNDVFRSVRLMDGDQSIALFHAQGADPVRRDEHVVQVRLHVLLEPRPRALERPAYVVRADREPARERRPERAHVGGSDEHRVVGPAAACHAVPLSTMLQYTPT